MSFKNLMITSTLVGGALFLSSSLVAQETAKDLYNENCGTCHQADGGGVPFQQPELIDSVKVLGDKKDLIKFVMEGTANSPNMDSEWGNVMPAFDYLDSSELSKILTYIRTSFGNNASPITQQDVEDVLKEQS